MNYSNLFKVGSRPLGSIGKNVGRGGRAAAGARGMMQPKYSSRAQGGLSATFGKQGQRGINASSALLRAGRRRR